MLRLEKLEINGFKSFADRTSLVFGSGITGVVGPNGCGKSNIAEAVAWVLGEQSAKHLRSGKMEDVIFNGTRDRKPMGLSEVMLTLFAVEDITKLEDDTATDDSEYESALETAARADAAAKAIVRQMDEPQPELPGSQPPDVSAETATGVKAEHRHSKPFVRKPKKKIMVSAGDRVVVGRRLYRTGDSDYVMNGKLCLLRDVQDLFAGTGLGGAQYAIIEQGRIGQILSSKPLDRRALIEEAAGITKFKSKKRATELRLDSAKQNLTRLNDIISEVERQVNSLKRQAAKSRRYRRLKEEMRSMQKLIFTADYHRLNQASEQIKQDREVAGIAMNRLDIQLVEREAEHRAISAEARIIEDDLTGLRERASTLELEADRARNRRAFEEEQVKELAARSVEVEKGQDQLVERLALLRVEIERRNAELAVIQHEVNAEQNELISRETGYQGGLTALRDAEAASERLRQQLLAEIGATERLRTMSSSLEEALRRLDLKTSNLTSELERAGLRKNDAATEHARVQSETAEGRAQLGAISETLALRRVALQSTRAETSRVQAQLDDASGRLSAANQRLASLEDLDAHHAYYSDAVQQVLSPETASRINALGTLADFVDVEPAYERLVESLFGRELQCVLVPTIDDALAGVACLNADELGRGGFLVVGLHGAEGEPADFPIEPSAELSDGAPSEESVSAAFDEMTGREMQDLIPDFLFDEPEAPKFQLDVLRAIDLMGLRPEIHAIVERAFPDKCAAAVVPDLEAALQLSMENGWKTYVTTNGEQVVNGRLIVNAAPEGKKGTSLLALKREIRQLREQADELSGVATAAAAELAASTGGLRELDAEVQSLDAELRGLEKKVAAAEAGMQGLARDLERAEQHVRVVESEIEQTATERIEVGAKINSVRAEFEAAQKSRDSVQEILTGAQSEIARMKEQVEQLSGDLSSARAAAAARAERLRSAQSELRRIEAEAVDLRSRIDRNQLELTENQGRIEQLTSSLTEAAALSERLAGDVAILGEEIGSKATALATVRGRFDDIEKLLVELRQSAATAHARKNQIDIDQARIEADAEHLIRLCYSELAMPLEDVVTSVALGQGMAMSQQDQPEGGEEEQIGGLAADSEEAPSEPVANGEPGVDIDVEGARARLEELRDKIDDLGPVNMMAPEELDEGEERFKFLTEQRRDILDSIKDTEDALSEIRKMTREKFRDAFEHVNANFQVMFQELFGGGRGEMILIDEDDILESGIDLIAQPPGKRLQNVLLLSGGEKAMAALALVLAIFQYRPSPFCLLDEVDAPLDEANVGRFSEKITEMSQNTQFLVITHNKKTMESASALYGVTMEEPGVSKLVSVRLE